VVENVPIHQEEHIYVIVLRLEPVTQPGHIKLRIIIPIPLLVWWCEGGSDLTLGIGAYQNPTTKIQQQTLGA